MAVLTGIERRFEASYGSGELQRSFCSWADDEAISAFPDLDSLISHCRDGRTDDLDLRDRVVAFLCLQATHDDRAALLLLWLHLPGLWEVVDGVRPGPAADPEELDAELLFGFWQAAQGATRPNWISSRLMTRAYWRRWEARRQANAHYSQCTPEDLNPQAITFGEASDAIWEAHRADVITEIEAWLVEVTRLVGASDREAAHELGISRNAARKRRLRAEARLVAWILDEEIPVRRNLDGRGLKRPKGMSCVRAGSSNGAKATSKAGRKEGSPPLRLGEPVQQVG
jgi:hypothetical protein